MLKHAAFIVLVKLMFVYGPLNFVDAANYFRYRRQTDSSGCTLPSHPEHGRWTVLNGNGNPGGRVLIASVIIFECDAGYKLSSKIPLVCLGQWSSPAPECDELCPPLYPSDTYDLTCVDKVGKEVSCTEAGHGTILEYTCKTSYETPFGYKKTLFCENGKWDRSTPVCQPVCGKKISNDAKPTIYGTDPNEKIEYPWIAAIYSKLKDSFENVCVGSILSQTVVLTAAHCVTNDFGNVLPTEDYLIGVGKLYRSYQAPEDKNAQYLELSKIIVPEEYKADTRKFSADIAVLVVKKEISLTKVVQPVCFTNVKNIHLHAGSIGEVSGWGFTESNTPSEVLRTLVIPYKYETICANELPPDWADRYNSKDKICAGFVNKSMSVCTGDSGGGLAFRYREDNRYYIHGIVSLSHQIEGMCNIQQNSLYTSVAYYYDFVDRLLTKYAPQIKDCVLPAYPQNGKWTTGKDYKPGDSVPSSTLLKFQCDEGFILSSTAKVECKASYKMPTCEKLCEPLQFPRDTEYYCYNKVSDISDCKKAVEGWALSYTCPSGYLETNYLRVINCAKGTWGRPKPECIPELCPPLYPSNTYDLKCTDKVGREVNCSEATQETNLEYTCKTHYETPPLYKTALFCENGKWDHTRPVCQPVCGKKVTSDIKTLIYGSKPNEKIEYPWVAAIYQKMNNSYENICGGSILSQTVILTAAHCVTNDYGDVLPKENYMVGVGKLYRRYQASEDTRAQYLELYKIVVHEDYKADIQQYKADIGVLVVKEEITLNEVIQPVCFTNMKNIRLHAGNKGEVSGWGLAEGESPSEVLRSLVIPYKYETSCANELPPDWADRYNSKDKICAGFVNKSTSVCSGDSGGGLAFKYREDNRYYIHGIVSISHRAGYMCDIQQNALYTSVASYYEFVEHLLTKYAPKIKDCVLPPYPQNGKWTTEQGNWKPGDAVPSNTILTVHCDGTFILSSTASVECSAAHSLPSCEMPCPRLLFPRGTNYQCQNREMQVIDCSEAVDGSSLWYDCHRKYIKAEDSPRRTCIKGSWGSPKPECILECGKTVVDDSGMGFEYPWNVGVYKINSNADENKREEEKYKYNCGGSLVSEYVVVTTAQCVTNESHHLLSKDDYLIGAGKLYRGFNDSRDTHAQFARITYINVHPRYKSSRGSEYKVALLIASAPFSFNNFVQPVCVAELGELFLSHGETRMMIGWRSTEGVYTETVESLEVIEPERMACNDSSELGFTAFPERSCSEFKNKSICLLPEDQGKGIVVRYKENNRYYLHSLVIYYKNTMCQNVFRITHLTDFAEIIHATMFYL